MQQMATMSLSQFVASASEILPPLAALCHRQLPEFVAICRGRGAVSSHLTFICSLPRFSADDLFCPLMTDTAQRKHGGKAFHSILEPHFDFIRQQRQRRKTWQEIADLLLAEKDIRVTLYAPYHFYRRRLKRAAHWENSAADSQPARPSAATSRPQSRPALLPMKPDFKRPNLSTINTEEFT
jgi:hypothetical protein